MPLAIQKAYAGRSSERGIEVELNGSTIWYPVVGRHGASKVYMQPASEGTGVIAGSTMRAVLESARCPQCAVPRATARPIRSMWSERPFDALEEHEFSGERSLPSVAKPLRKLAPELLALAETACSQVSKVAAVMSEKSIRVTLVRKSSRPAEEGTKHVLPDWGLRRIGPHRWRLKTRPQFAG